MTDIRELATDALEWAQKLGAMPESWLMGRIEEEAAASQRLLLWENDETLFFGLPVRMTTEKSCLRVVSDSATVI